MALFFSTFFGNNAFILVFSCPAYLCMLHVLAPPHPLPHLTGAPVAPDDGHSELCVSGGALAAVLKGDPTHPPAPGTVLPRLTLHVHQQMVLWLSINISCVWHRPFQRRPVCVMFNWTISLGFSWMPGAFLFVRGGRGLVGDIFHP